MQEIKIIINIKIVVLIWRNFNFGGSWSQARTSSSKFPPFIIYIYVYHKLGVELFGRG